MYIVMQQVNPSDTSTISSNDMHKKVLQVHKRLKQRDQECFNAKLSDEEIEKYCKLSIRAKETLDIATERFSLSFRAIKKIQKVSLTIADLNSSDTIEKDHILEALSYRRRD